MRRICKLARLFFKAIVRKFQFINLRLLLTCVQRLQLQVTVTGLQYIHWRQGCRNVYSKADHGQKCIMYGYMYVHVVVLSDN